MTETQPEDKKLLDPETNEVNISTKREARFYIFLSKVILYTQHTAPQTYVTRCELTTKRAFSNFF